MLEHVRNLFIINLQCVVGNPGEGGGRGEGKGGVEGEGRKGDQDLTLLNNYT